MTAHTRTLGALGILYTDCTAVGTTPDALLAIAAQCDASRRSRPYARSTEPLPAELIRATWDYRVHGLTVDAARALLRRITTARADAQSRRRYHPAHGHRPSPSEPRILLLQRERQAYRRADAILVGHLGRYGLTPAAWLTARLTWDSHRLILALGDGQYLVTTRHEDADWAPRRSRPRRYPTHTQVSYSSCVWQSGLPPQAPAPPYGTEWTLIAQCPSVTHDCRGDWRTRVCRALGLLGEDEPLVSEGPSHEWGAGTSFHRRGLLGLELDFVAVHADGADYHAPTVRGALAGLTAKRAIQAQTAAVEAGILLTLESAHERYGFCEQGLGEFCALVGLDPTGAYDRDALRAAVEAVPEARTRYGRDLAVAGI